MTAGKVAGDAGRQRASFVVIGSSRSGTTSLCNILDLAKNGICVQEPEPNLNIETRLAMEKRYQWPDALIDQTVAARARVVWKKGLIYGEKNVTLGPFIPQLAERGFRIVVIKRDGREVVQSMINWHNHLFGNIYRECTEKTHLSAQAQKTIENLPLAEDYSDYARPRPGQSDPFHERWPTFTRLEMCSWYWAYIYNLFIDELEKLPGFFWRTIDYSHVTPTDIRKIAAFVGLEKPELCAIRKLLARRINSVQHRTESPRTIRSWKDWTDNEKAQFECIAASTMMRLGYYDRLRHIRFRPRCYGDWWRSQSANLDWYTWMYNSRRKAHEDLLAFIHKLEQEGARVDSLLDVGCGCGVGYREAFADRRYVGMDLSEENIVFCREHQNEKHSFFAGDIILDVPKEKFDLVFSQGSIDNSYDVNAYLRSMVRASRQWIYLTAYRGWFPHLNEHRYMWDESTTCFYNDVAPCEVEDVLREMGCTQISVQPLPMGPDATVCSETRITARVPLV